TYVWKAIVHCHRCIELSFSVACHLIHRSRRAGKRRSLREYTSYTLFKRIGSSPVPRAPQQGPLLRLLGRDSRQKISSPLRARADAKRILRSNCENFERAKRSKNLERDAHPNRRKRGLKYLFC